MVQHLFLEFLILCSSNSWNFHCSLQGGKVSLHGLPASRRCIFLYCEGLCFVLFLFSFDISVKRTVSIKMRFCPSTEQKMNLLVTTDSVCENEVEAWIYFKGHSSILKYPLLKHCSMCLKLMFCSASHPAMLFR